MKGKTLKKVDLRKCPFCGGNAYFEHYCEEWYFKDKVYIRCHGCGIRSPELVYAGEPDGELVIEGTFEKCLNKLAKIWNHRAAG